MADAHEVLDLDDRLVLACLIAADADSGRGDGGGVAFQIGPLVLGEAAAAAAAVVADLVVWRDCDDADERAGYVLDEGHWQTVNMFVGAHLRNEDHIAMLEMMVVAEPDGYQDLSDTSPWHLIVAAHAWTLVVEVEQSASAAARGHEA